MESSCRTARDLPTLFRPLAKKAMEQGWRIVITHRNHYKWFSPDGQGIVVTAKSASDHRALANTISKMTKFGYTK